jgi:ribosomal 30S subunit maturation factor RimM
VPDVHSRQVVVDREGRWIGVVAEVVEQGGMTLLAVRSAGLRRPRLVPAGGAPAAWPDGRAA